MRRAMGLVCACMIGVSVVMGAGISRAQDAQEVEATLSAHILPDPIETEPVTH